MHTTESPPTAKAPRPRRRPLPPAAGAQAPWRTPTPSGRSGTATRRPRAAPLRLQLEPVAPIEVKHDPWQRGLAVSGIVTAIVLAVGLGLTARSTGEQQEATRAQLRITEQGQLNERFTKAIDQLGQEGSAKLSIRLGGIHALQQLMRDSPRHQDSVVGVLAAHVRTHDVTGRIAPPRTDQPRPAPPRASTGRPIRPAYPVDLQTALTTIAQRPHPDAHPPVNLAGADLRGAWLTNAQLDRADLQGADLSTAVLQGAQLAGANLVRASLFAADLTAADLTGANARHGTLSEADASGAVLTGANLDEAYLVKADLTGAELTGATLSEARFKRADLSGAKLAESDLRRTDFDGALLAGATLAGANHLAGEQLRCARLDATTTLPTGVRRPDARQHQPDCRHAPRD